MSVAIKSYDKILESLASSFAQIEVQNVRVGRIIVPPEYLVAIRHDPRSQFLADWTVPSVQPPPTRYEPMTAPAVDWPAQYEAARARRRTEPRVIWDDTRTNPQITWNDTRGDAHDPVYGRPPYRTVGRLWGAELVVGSKFMVTGDAGFEHITYPVMKHFLSGIYVHVKSRVEWSSGIFPKNEWVALNTLREMITETEFRKYLKYGFLLVRGASGDVYQIWRVKHHVNVWCLRKDGQGSVRLHKG